MARWGEGSPYRASFDFEGRYVIRTVDFAPTKLRRKDFWAPSCAILFCAGLMSAVAFAAALHSPANDTVVVAGAFDCRAHPIAPAWFLRLACESATEAAEATSIPAHLENVSDSRHAIS
jgi:hypothetical protein